MPGEVGIGEYFMLGIPLMAAASAFGVVNFVFGATSLNAMGRPRIFLISVAFSGAVSLIVAFSLIPGFGSSGAFFAFAIGETVLAILVVGAHLVVLQKREKQ
jgi:O-antigen/teichoic acid export membrane protein